MTEKTVHFLDTGESSIVDKEWENRIFCTPLDGHRGRIWVDIFMNNLKAKDVKICVEKPKFPKFKTSHKFEYFDELTKGIWNCPTINLEPEGQIAEMSEVEICDINNVCGEGNYLRLEIAAEKLDQNLTPRLQKKIPMGYKVSILEQYHGFPVPKVVALGFAGVLVSLIWVPIARRFLSWFLRPKKSKKRE